MVRHPIFVKYKRSWLQRVTGFSQSHLSRVATGKAPLTGRLIRRACRKLGEPVGALFLLDTIQAGNHHEPCGCPQSEIGQWLEARCRNEHLSLRKAAARADVSHTTIADIMDGRRPSAVTIKKLARTFAGNGQHQRAALEDELLALAGYRSAQSESADLRYLKVISLLSPKNQHVIEALVWELAKIEGIEHLHKMKTAETIM